MIFLLWLTTVIYELDETGSSIQYKMDVLIIKNTRIFNATNAILLFQIKYS